MTDLAVAIPASLACFAGLWWILRSRGSRATPTQFPADFNLDVALPKHYRYLPQVRQALCMSDEQFLRDKLPRNIARKALGERRTVAKTFLLGLREDFHNLERLARMLAALSPKISREQETERLLLTMRFQVSYAIVWLQLATGKIPFRQVEHLAALVGSFAAQIENAMASLGPLQTT